MSESLATGDAKTGLGRALNWVAIAIVGLEAAALWAVVIVLLLGMIGGAADSLSSGIALAVLAAIAAVWMSAAAAALARRRRWALGSIITWQVMQFAIAVGAVQGSDPNWGLALLLAMPAAGAVVLVLLRPVRELTA